MVHYQVRLNREEEEGVVVVVVVVVERRKRKNACYLLLPLCTQNEYEWYCH